MRKEKEWRAIYAFVIVSIIFSAVALFVPWWSFNTSPEATVILNSYIKTDYYLYQTVTAIKTVENETEVQSVTLSYLTENQQASGEASFWLSITYSIAISGLALSCIMAAITFLPQFSIIFRRYMRPIGYIAAMLLFIAPIVLATNFSAITSKLSNLTPLNIPSTWPPISPKSIVGFWGSLSIQKQYGFPEWATDGNFWVWGADIGWYLTFTASLLMALATSVAHVIVRKEMEKK